MAGLFRSSNFKQLCCLSQWFLQVIFYFLNFLCVDLYVMVSLFKESVYYTFYIRWWSLSPSSHWPTLTHVILSSLLIIYVIWAHKLYCCLHFFFFSKERIIIWSGTKHVRETVLKVPSIWVLLSNCITIAFSSIKMVMLARLDLFLGGAFGNIYDGNEKKKKHGYIITWPVPIYLRLT